MFDPDGYFPVPHVVWLLAQWGAEGKLPRHLGFVHPGDIADPLDLTAEENARRMLGGKLAVGAITASARLYPIGGWLAVPAHYWGSDTADATMQRGELDPSILARALGLDLEAGLFAATVFLAIDKVTAALGFRLAPADDVPPVSQESAATEAAPHAALKPFNFEAVRVELTVSKAFWENRGRPTPAPTQEDIQKLLKQRYDPKTWTRRHVRALHQIWPEEARRRGPRKPPRRNSRRK